jgi:hypothetical protein
MGRRAQTLEKILDNTDKVGDCLVWKGCKDKDGYGLTTIKGIKMPAHRAAKSFLEDVTGKYVLHTCTQRGCVNPDHLYVGTQKQNVQDQINAGTFVRGSKNGRALLDEMSVEHIRQSMFSNRQLASYYNVSYFTIWDARKGKSWKHLL